MPHETSKLKQIGLQLGSALLLQRKTRITVIMTVVNVNAQHQIKFLLTMP